LKKYLLNYTVFHIHKTGEKLIQNMLNGTLKTIRAKMVCDRLQKIEEDERDVYI